MKDWKTTLCGVLAAASLLGFTEMGLPDPWPKVLAWLCAVALAALGYHATDCSSCPGLTARKAAGLATVLALCLLAGCTLSKLSVQVGAPAFGTVKMTIGGGAIGKFVGTAATNAPPCVQNAPGATGATNRPTSLIVPTNAPTTAP